MTKELSLQGLNGSCKGIFLCVISGPSIPQGNSMLSRRSFVCSNKALLSVTVFFLILRFSRSTVFAGIGWLMSLAFVDIAKSSGCPIFPAILFSLLGVFFLSRYVSERRTTSMYWSAACIVAAALFRHDLGFYAAAAALLTLIT
jgi:uncharacterized membrane protein